MPFVHVLLQFIAFLGSPSPKSSRLSYPSSAILNSGAISSLCCCLLSHAKAITMARHAITRSMVSLTRQMQSVSFTPEGAVSISYPTLVSSPLSLQASVGWYLLGTLEDRSDPIIPEQAFGSHPKSLGIIIVKDLPPIYTEYRQKLLKLAHKFATLDEVTREKYADPETKYRFVFILLCDMFLLSRPAWLVLAGPMARYCPKLTEHAAKILMVCH